MRRFKEIRKVIREFYDTPAGSAPSGLRGRVGPQDGQNAVDFNQNLAKLNPGEVSRINTYLGALSAKAYINPNEAMKEIWNSLSSIGLNFKLIQGDDLYRPGTRCYELNLFGGSFGADGTRYGYNPPDDNIERKIGVKLGLEVTSQPTSGGRVALHARIVNM